MHILIICHYFPPLHSIASLRPYSFAKYWIEAGHNVTVLTTAKNSDMLTLPAIEGLNIVEIDYQGRSAIGRAKSENSPSTHNVSNGTFRNVLIKFANSLRSKYGILAAERIPELISPWIFSAKKYIKKNINNFDVVVSEYSPPSALYLGNYAKKYSKNNLKLVFDYRDSWTKSNYSQPGFPVVRLLERFLESLFIKNADLISATQRGIALEFNDRGLANTIVIENGYFDDLDFSAPAHKIHETAIVYTGSYGGYRSVEFLEGALNIIEAEQPDLYERLAIYVIGNGTSSAKHPKLIFTGKVSYETALQYQQQAAVLFLIESGAEIARYNIPGKFFEYYKYQKPIIAFGPKADFELSRYLSENKIGKACDATSHEAAKTIVELIRDRSKYEGIGLDLFTRKKMALKLLQKIESL